MTTPHSRSPRPAAPPPGRQGEPRAAATIRKDPRGGGHGRARAGGAGRAGAMAQQVEQLRADGVDKEVLREGTGPLPDFRDGTKVRSAGGRAGRGDVGSGTRRSRRACAPSPLPSCHGDAAGSSCSFRPLSTTGRCDAAMKRRRWTTAGRGGSPWSSSPGKSSSCRCGKRRCEPCGPASAHASAATPR